MDKSPKRKNKMSKPLSSEERAAKKRLTLIKQAKARDVEFQKELIGEQIEAVNKMMSSKIALLEGKAGTAKTFLTAFAALKLLFSGEVEKIIITRPTVEAAGSGELGFLPGGIDIKNGKMAPYLMPVLGNMTSIVPKHEIEALISNEKLITVPLQFIRGLNLENAVLIVDESQSVNTEMFELIATRLCSGGKIFLTVDNDQIDLKRKSDSYYEWVKEVSEIDGVEHILLYENHRDELVQLVLEKLKGLKAKKLKHEEEIKQERERNKAEQYKLRTQFSAGYWSQPNWSESKF